MLRAPIRCTAGFMLCGLLFASVANAQQIKLQPVRSNGEVISNDGTEIVLAGGGDDIIVEMSIMLNGWGYSPGNPDLIAIRAAACGEYRGVSPVSLCGGVSQCLVANFLSACS